MKQKILENLPAECPWRDTLHWFNSIDSTNNEAKRLAQTGAPHGTVLIAGHQSQGRGRMGRSFDSAQGMGIYLSVILRPHCTAQALMHLTCAVGVAMCDAIELAAGFRPGIKWINDLVAGNKKLGGILTELSVDPQSGLIQYAVVGIGINCDQTPEDFPPELREIASSVRMHTGHAIRKERLAAAMILALEQMDKRLLRHDFMVTYRKDCVTLGQPVVVLRAGEKRYGTALDVDAQGGLIVRFEDGCVQTVQSGEVSVRGMYGYI